MGAGAAGIEPTSIIQRVRAAERVVADRVYVAPVGWTSDVYELAGAAAAVWLALDEPGSIADIAKRTDVTPDDSLLSMAIDSLLTRRLIAAESR